MMEFQTNKPQSKPEHDVPSAPPVPKQMLAGTDKPRYAMPVQRPAVSQKPQLPEHQFEAVADDRPSDLVIDDVRDDTEDAADADTSEVNVFQKVFGGYWRHKLWTLPLTLLVAVGAVFVVPASRYPVLALFITRPFAVTVTDSTTNAPVSGVKVSLDGQSKLTDSTGKVSFVVKVGEQKITATKANYKDFSQDRFVDVVPDHYTLAVHLVATGRQVPVKVINKITGKPIPEAEITVGSSTAKTDLDGTATIVVSAADGTLQGKVTVDGYNDLPAAVQVITSAVDANTFAMIPKGHVYFLSNLSGKIDVVSTNLDGSNRETVLAGTGNEDKNSTVLLASRDWQYLALLSKRDGGDHPKLFLINTANGKTSTIDNTGTDYTLVGWNGHYFVYQVAHADVTAWQSGGAVLKSYGADTGNAITIATSSASGTSNSDAQYQSISQANFVGGTLVYTETWYRYPGYLSVSGQQNVLVGVKPDGTGSKTLKSVDSGQYYVSSLKLAKPNQLYFAVYDNTNSNANYYRLDDRGNVTQSDTITSDSVNQNYPTYLLSPSGSATFWSEARDGKNALLVGDYQGVGGSTIANLSDYAPYGWFSDDYVLVQKNKSELFIMPAAGGTALKISDYFKPDYYLYGYGGGYGGL